MVQVIWFEFRKCRLVPRRLSVKAPVVAESWGDEAVLHEAVNGSCVLQETQMTVATPMFGRWLNDLSSSAGGDIVRRRFKRGSIVLLIIRNGRRERTGGHLLNMFDRAL